MRNEPSTLTKNVWKGNFSNKPLSGEMFIKYLATDPNAPPMATEHILKIVLSIWKADSVCLREQLY